MKKLFITATLTVITLATPLTVSAKSKTNVRYSTGIVTGAKSITTQDYNIWRSKL